jgi:prepilin-type N-terminal cleavage/methylation domain-containing protein
MKRSVQKQRRGARPGLSCKSFVIKGFTLVELLVVIAIIGILAALLLSALKKAKDMSLTIDCKGRLKTLGLATALYIGDWDEIIPHEINDQSGGSTEAHVVFVRLIDYTSPKISDSVSASKPVINNPAMCPAYVNYTKYGGVNGASAPYQDYSRSSYNYFHTYTQSSFLALGYWGGDWASPPTRGYRATKMYIRVREILYPSETLNFIETRNNSLNCNFLANALGIVRYNERHGFAAPSVMFDGSVRVWQKSVYSKFTDNYMPYGGKPGLNSPSVEYWRAWALYLWWKY